MYSASTVELYRFSFDMYIVTKQQVHKSDPMQHIIKKLKENVLNLTAMWAATIYMYMN